MTQNLDLLNMTWTRTRYARFDRFADTPFPGRLAVNLLPEV